MRDAAAAVSAVLVLASNPFARPQTQQPVFRGTTDIVVVDARVVDGDGRPILNLTAADFEIQVDGKPRTVVSLEYQTDSGSAGAPSVAQQSAILVVVDRSNLRMETSRDMLDAAAEFVEGLPASHGVGFLLVPEDRLAVPIGGERARIAATLKKTLGTYGQKTNPAEDELMTRSALHRAIGAVSAVEGRRTVIYLADRLSSTNTTDLARRAALSGVAFYVLSSDAPVISSDTRNKPAAQTDDVLGLPGLATASGGAWLRRWAGARAIFERVARELSGQYLLTFAADPSGDKGRHAIGVRVKRDGASVRARREFVR
jgi:VWFA-related protein